MHATGSQYRQYRAVQVDEDDVYTHQVFTPDEKDYLGPNMTPAQAEVFAFSLNAVASGHQLQSFDGENVFEYEGPTEGVRE